MASKKSFFNTAHMKVAISNSVIHCENGLFAESTLKRVLTLNALIAISYLIEVLDIMGLHIR